MKRILAGILCVFFAASVVSFALREKGLFEPMKIVRFEDGRYGIRRVIMGRHQFLDLDVNTVWWGTKSSRTFYRGTLEECQSVIS